MIFQESDLEKTAGLLKHMKTKELLDNPEFKYAISDFNTIPFGEPSDLKEKLLVIFDDENTIDNVYDMIFEYFKNNEKTKSMIAINNIRPRTFFDNFKKYNSYFTNLEENGVEIKII